MAPLALPTIQTSRIPYKSSFLGEIPTTRHRSTPAHRLHLPRPFTPTAKFNLLELLGGRGLCNGEKGIGKELEIPKKPPSDPDMSLPSSPTTTSSFDAGEGAFEKELLGLTGGFPGGEKGLMQFVEKNPPPPKKNKEGDGGLGGGFLAARPEAPKLPLLMPGMVVIVKNESHPFHMYCGIVQRVTDGKVGVLFEGGNWDKLITFDIGELERREKGPPMVNPKSAVLEDLMGK